MYHGLPALQYRKPAPQRYTNSKKDRNITVPAAEDPERAEPSASDMHKNCMIQDQFSVSADNSFDRFENSGGHGRIVHGIEMNAVNTVSNNINNLINGVCTPDFEHGIRIVTESVHDTAEFFRKRCFAQLNHAVNLS